MEHCFKEIFVNINETIGIIDACNIQIFIDTTIDFQ